MNDNNRSTLEQLNELERSIDNFVSQGDITVMNRIKNLLPKLRIQIDKAKRANLNVDSLETTAKDLEQRVEKFLREYQ